MNNNQVTSKAMRGMCYVYSHEVKKAKQLNTATVAILYFRIVI